MFQKCMWWLVSDTLLQPTSATNALLLLFFQSALGQKASAFSVRAWNCYTWNCLESKYHFIYVWQYTCTTRMPMLQATWESLFYVQRTGEVLGYVYQPREQGLRSQTYIIAPQLFHVAIRTTPCCQLQTWKMLQLQPWNHNPHMISLILNSTCPNQSFDRLYSWPVKPLRYHLACKKIITDLSHPCSSWYCCLFFVSPPFWVAKEKLPSFLRHTGHTEIMFHLNRPWYMYI